MSPFQVRKLTISWLCEVSDPGASHACHWNTMSLNFIS